MVGKGVSAPHIQDQGEGLTCSDSLQRGREAVSQALLSGTWAALAQRLSSPGTAAGPAVMAAVGGFTSSCPDLAAAFLDFLPRFTSLEEKGQRRGLMAP